MKNKNCHRKFKTIKQFDAYDSRKKKLSFTQEERKVHEAYQMLLWEYPKRIRMHLRHKRPPQYSFEKVHNVYANAKEMKTASESMMILKYVKGNHILEQLVSRKANIYDISMNNYKHVQHIEFQFQTVKHRCTKKRRSMLPNQRKTQCQISPISGNFRWITHLFGESSQKGFFHIT